MRDSIFKRRKRNVFKDQKWYKQNMFVVFVTFIVLTFMSVGYAALQQGMSIQGEVVVRAEKDIRITFIESNPSISCGYDLFNPRYDEYTITVNLSLPELTCTMEYTVIVRNFGIVVMELNDIIEDNHNNEDIEYEVNDIKIGDIILPNETKIFKITYKYKTSVSVLPDNNNLGSIIRFVLIEHIPGGIILGDDFASHIIGLAADSANTKVVNETSTEWRYQGPGVDNYLLFNNETWRIIGVFSDDTHGMSGLRMAKIVRQETIGGRPWDPSGHNDWPNTALFAELNGSFLNGINQTSRDMIANVNWKIGTLPFGRTITDFYTEERRGVAVPAYVGIKHSTDMAFAAPAAGCPRGTQYMAPGFLVLGCTDQSWLTPSGFVWTLNQSSGTTQGIYIGNDGAGGAAVHFALPIFPSLYIKANTKILAGNGSISNPYIISLK